MLYPEITEENIGHLISNFYKKIYADKDLGPVFKKTLGETWEEWESHLEVLCNFWSSMMLATKKYKGNPASKHLALPAFDINLFGRWLALFAETTDAIYEENVSLQFKLKSQRIAESLKLLLYYKSK